MTEAASTTVGTLGLVERVAALHRGELFARIPGRVLAAVAEHTAEVRASPGEVMIEEGAVEAHLYALVHGRVRVHRGDQTLVELGPGTTVGELGPLDQEIVQDSLVEAEGEGRLQRSHRGGSRLRHEGRELAHGGAGS